MAAIRSSAVIVGSRFATRPSDSGRMSRSSSELAALTRAAMRRQNRQWSSYRKMSWLLPAADTWSIVPGIRHRTLRAAVLR